VSSEIITYLFLLEVKTY